MCAHVLACADSSGQHSLLSCCMLRIASLVNLLICDAFAGLLAGWPLHSADGGGLVLGHPGGTAAGFHHSPQAHQGGAGSLVLLRRQVSAPLNLVCAQCSCGYITSECILVCRWLCPCMSCSRESSIRGRYSQTSRSCYKCDRAPKVPDMITRSLTACALLDGGRLSCVVVK